MFAISRVVLHTWGRGAEINSYTSTIIMDPEKKLTEKEGTKSRRRKERNN
jgi:hypothetical protein